MLTEAREAGLLLPIHFHSYPDLSMFAPRDNSCVAGVAGPQRDQRDRQRQLQGQRQEADQGRSGHQEARGSPLQVGSTRAPDKCQLPPSS